MAVGIFPTVGDTISEASLARILADAGGDFIPDGFTVVSHSSLQLVLSAGRAMIAGRNIVIDTSTAGIFVTNNATTYVYLQALLDGLWNMTGAAFVTNTTGVAPANAIPICFAVASGGVITSTTDLRKTTIATSIAYGEFTGTATPRTIVVGFTPTFVLLAEDPPYVSAGTASWFFIGLGYKGYPLNTGGRLTGSNIVLKGFYLNEFDQAGKPNRSGRGYAWVAFA